MGFLVGQVYGVLQQFEVCQQIYYFTLNKPSKDTEKHSSYTDVLKFDFFRHSKYEVLQAGRQLAFNLIETVQQEWSNIQQQQQAQQQQAQQQQQSVGQQPPPAQQHQGQAQVSSQQSDNQPQPSIQQHIQSIPNHLHAQGMW